MRFNIMSARAQSWSDLKEIYVPQRTLPGFILHQKNDKLRTLVVVYVIYIYINVYPSIWGVAHSTQRYLSSEVRPIFIPRVSTFSGLSRPRCWRARPFTLIRPIIYFRCVLRSAYTHRTLCCLFVFDNEITNKKKPHNPQRIQWIQNGSHT